MNAIHDSAARVRIRGLLKLMVLFAGVVLLVVVLSYALSRPGDVRGETLRVDLSDIEPGTAKRLNWRNRQILVVHRDAAWQQALAADAELVDPGARRGQQPDDLDLPLRSYRPEWLVVIGESTDLGCELELVHPDAAEDWSGGFLDRCRGGRYDGAGRVYAGQDARRNLPIPQYRLTDPDTLILGGD